MLFSPRTLRSIIAGESAVDLPELSVRTRAEALAFLDAYGLGEEDEADRRHGAWLRQKALEVLEGHILREGEAVPPAVREQADLPTLLLWASHAGPDWPESPGARRRQQAWSCVLLRVAHTLAHAYSALNERYAADIREQIAGRFSRHVHGEGESLRLGEGEDSVPLVELKIRPMKTLEAATLKLLRAAENVAAGVFDWMGVRLVTRDAGDALLAVRYLRAHHVIAFANIIPGRSRNSMFDLEAIEPRLAEIEASIEDPAQKIAAVRAMARASMAAGSDHRVHNEHSSASYRAIQFTGRELVKLPVGPELPDARFFFPFEVQILAAADYAESREGPASHRAYKQRQLEAVRRRVLAGVE